MSRHRPHAHAPADDLDALKVEHDENEQRKEPTVSEKVALAGAIAERLQGRNKRPEKHGNISTLTDQGATRDLAAAKAGLGSGKTLEAAQKVVEHGAPELVALAPQEFRPGDCCKGLDFKSEQAGPAPLVEFRISNPEVRALVGDFKGLALVKQQDASPELDSGQGEQLGKGRAVRKPCTSGYMVAT